MIACVLSRFRMRGTAQPFLMRHSQASLCPVFLPLKQFTAVDFLTETLNFS